MEGPPPGLALTLDPAGLALTPDPAGHGPAAPAPEPGSLLILPATACQGPRPPLSGLREVKLQPSSGSLDSVSMTPSTGLPRPQLLRQPRLLAAVDAGSGAGHAGGPEEPQQQACGKTSGGAPQLPALQSLALEAPAAGAGSGKHGAAPAAGAGSAKHAAGVSES